MNENMLGYIKEDSIIHNLTGATKLICFILWTLTSMLTYDTRILFIMFIFSIVVFKLSKIKFKDVSFIFYFILFFLILNNIAIFIFSPYEGVNIYGTEHKLLHLIGPYNITTEQLFYQLNVTIKYFSVIPMALLFISTTEPSEFASSLNRIGISYKIAYSVSIALRYIPDIQRDYQDISFAQQARGIDMSKKEKFIKRIKNIAAILMPLIFSSLDRIEKITSAMELRGFGNKKSRTWYNANRFNKNDYMAIIMVIVLFIVSLMITVNNGNRFYNPFV
ncbi:energy-coupling factor transporter transmembrane component T family protein [Clostridium septicum]|uniref:Energy-coupling factor transporter transmembrane protein EcfT n=1 Tax=Clostridium septicum TaxID=1504 RepID=A0A9N7JM83_CLOSE|nr:energy-coupling factor transporter transmembrane component T [Clostridium septicum]AYE35234.1 energy-coupling factor transporter transmembrane protein EcfT [Clostridium septicum]MDU1313654.1 energy-coupling factor transporter transmembrane component T [Clostridium septicum]QAS60629.1 energy-coupling factor transporter transmembrane protein EcfT [Clostridium septicum]UEC20115.1 energy-coupling factor transporter transmembrane protein EcfT [Clostridium septicum]USS01828.1 energy-coupling fact